MPLSREQVMSALTAPRGPQNVPTVAATAVKEVHIEGATVTVTLDLPANVLQQRPTIERDVRSAIVAAGADSVQVKLLTSGAAPAKPNNPLPQVKHVVAVGAGKGGVGKSTISANLAVGLARTGAKVGLLDGDIYGPSMPTILGIKGRAPEVVGTKIIPFFVHGIHAITIGNLVEDEKPLIWRGPMAHGAFKQLLTDNVQWPALEYLIVDLPPGTGDVPLTLCQLLPLTGAVVVASPQQVALDDAVRAVRMFQQLGAPILGMVENMAGDIFGRGGTEATAGRLGLAFLGALELNASLRISSDAGTPEANFTGDPQVASALTAITTALVHAVEERDATSAAPSLTIT